MLPVFWDTPFGIFAGKVYALVLSGWYMPLLYSVNFGKPRPCILFLNILRVDIERPGVSTSQ